MTPIDIAALVLIGTGTVHGCIRGLSGELAHVTSVIAALVFGLWLHPPVAVWMAEHTRLGERPAQALAFTVTVLAALAGMLCVRFLLRRIMKVVIEQPFDRIAGAVSGCLRSCLIVVIFFVLFTMWPSDHLNRTFGEESVIGRFLHARLSILDRSQDYFETPD